MASSNRKNSWRVSFNKTALLGFVLINSLFFLSLKLFFPVFDNGLALTEGTVFSQFLLYLCFVEICNVLLDHMAEKTKTSSAIHISHHIPPPKVSHFELILNLCFVLFSFRPNKAHSYHRHWKVSKSRQAEKIDRIKSL